MRTNVRLITEDVIKIVITLSDLSYAHVRQDTPWQPTALAVKVYTDSTLKKLFSCIHTQFIDIDECLTDNGGCETTCFNTDGSFECSCDAGYILASNNFTCEGKSGWLISEGSHSMKW